MGVKQYKPSSPGRRFQTVSDFAEITTTKPEKSLLEPLPKKAGRNNYGRITTRHQGGGHKRKYRKIDFKRQKDGIPAKVATIEYDPNRSARIALLHYVDGAKAYILQPKGLKVGDIVDYKGSTHYTSANSSSPKACKGGKAKITQIYQLGKSKHPYHLIRISGSGATVWGWVDANTFSKT